MRQPRRAFKTTAENVLTIFNVRVRPLQAGPHPILATAFNHTYTFFVHRHELLQAFNEAQASSIPRKSVDGTRRVVVPHLS